MPETPLHHKPIFYGSALLDGLFLALVVLHILPGVLAPVAAVVSFATTKGSKRHIAWGKGFTRSMFVLAVTGLVLDAMRLGLYFTENHTKYAGYGMPSTVPARLGFLYAALCVLYLLRVVVPPRMHRRVGNVPSWERLMPSVLVAIGAGLTLTVFLRLNPWTGALWMIWTFMAATVWIGRLQARVTSHADAQRLHRWGMSILGAFSWWGALQGFGPAIGYAVRGPDLSTAAYQGHLPGAFSPAFLFFLVGWALPFAVGGLLVRRFTRLANQRAATSTQ